ncbi:FecR family protein [Marinilabilia rubra]|uniref:Anti-sigma factor n=1 Tax=Marinilabilia rubra TaxID=2162893 RepID=A0A2U2B5V9_9BACT|nr:FecR domain-containing protein [Marinilabilia rubra]PWD98458.1 anti-sigma factor [Marinilabilia rubra]
MKEILRKYIKGECTAAEFKEAVKALAGFSGQGELNDFMHKHWRDIQTEGFSGDKNRFSRVLDQIHHRINIEGPGPSLTRRLYAGFAKVAAILILPLMIVAGLFFSEYIGEKSIAMTTMSAPPGIQSIVDLPDGSKVWLNSESEITFPSSFQGVEKREVQLKGEGYFVVASNKTKPFIVSTETGLGVQVTGTEYNVSAYSNDPDVSVTLVEGSVQILDIKSDEQKVVSELKPGQVARLEKKSGAFNISGVENLAPYISWKEGKLVFINEPLTSVLRQMERKYNVKYQVEDEVLLDYRITGTFLNETLDEFLKLIATSSPIEYEVCRPEKGTDNIFEKRVVKLTSKK